MGELFKKDSVLIKPRSSEKDTDSSILEIENIKAYTFLSSFSKASKKTYSRILREFFLRWESLGLKEIESHHVELFLHHHLEGLSKESLALYKSGLSSFFKFLVADGYLTKNPVEALRKIKTDQTKFLSRIPEVDEVKRLIESCETERDKLLIEFLYMTGLRISEALSLKFSSFKSSKGKVKFTVVGKGNKTRRGQVSQRLFQRLKSLDGYEEEAALFRNLRRNKDKGITYIGAVSAFKKAYEKSKIKKKISLHSLRHAHATHAVQNKAPLKTLQMTLGHVSSATTMMYLHAGSEEHSGDYLEEF